MTRRDAVLLVLLGAVWGAVYPLTAVVLRELPTPAVVLARTALSALVLIPLALRKRVLRPVLSRWPPVVCAALLQATFPLVLLTTGQHHVSAALAGILLATQPIWAVALTWISEHGIGVRQLAGVLVALGGVVVLYSRDMHFGAASGWGGLELLAAAVCYAAGAVYIQRAIPDVSPLATATAAMTISAMAMIPFAVAAGFPLPGPITATWLVVLAVAATGGALVLFYALIRSIGAVRANLAGYLAPVFAVAYGSVFLGETIHVQDIAGLALILAGSFLAAS